MANYQNSQEYSTIHIPDVNEAFRSVIANKPVTISLIQVRGLATNHRHQWLEHRKTQTQWTVNGQSNSGSATVTLDSNVGVQVGDILKFASSAGVTNTVKVRVTAVDGGGANLTVTRLGTDANILDNSVATLVSRAKNENSTGSNGANAIPVKRHNFTQIFRRDFGLSRTTLQTKLYGLATEAERANKVMELVDFQVMNQLSDISWELNQSVLDGYREERVDGGAAGTMGGIIPFLEENTRSRYDAAAAAISQTILNNAIEQAVQNGANGMNLTVMLCHPTQARRISAFNTLGNNPVVVRGDVTAGSYVAQYQSDLGGTNGGALTTVIVDRNFPQDKVVILNPENLSLVPMQNFFVEETTDKDTDGRTWKLLGELTLEFMNYADEAILVENLDT